MEDAEAKIGSSMSVQMKISSAPTRYFSRDCHSLPARPPVPGTSVGSGLDDAGAHAWLRRVSIIWKTVKTRMMAARISDSAAP